MITAKIIDVIVNLEAAGKVEGGITKLRELLKSFNKTYRDDGRLAAISWMDMDSAFSSVKILCESGLQFDKHGKETDIAIFEMYGAIPHVNPKWIMHGTTQEGCKGYWLRDTEPEK